MDYTLTELVELLQGIPGIDNVHTRSALLLGIPHNIKKDIGRDRNSTINDITLIVDQLAEMKLEKGKIALSIILKNALPRAKRLAMAPRLEEILLQILELEKEAINGASSTFSFRTYHFDLVDMIRKCHGILLKKRGLVGFAIACDYPVFERNFCERLEYELRESGSKVKIQDPVPLDPKYHTLEDAIDQIKLFKQLLRSYKVICVVRVGDFNNAILDGFWLRLSNEFSEELANRLIIIMLGNLDCVFPNNFDNFFGLTVPKFTDYDIHLWVRHIVNKLNWPQDRIISIWEKHMLAECVRGSVVDIRFTYLCLDDHLLLLQEALSQGFTFEQFLLALEQRSKDYVPASC